MKALFKEKQKFNKLLLSLLLFTLGVYPVVLLFKEFDPDIFIDDFILDSLDLILLSLFIFGVLVIFILSKLTIFINQYGIFINFFPFMKRHIVWFKIKEAKFVECNDIGGYGIKLNTKFGTAFKIKGDIGLHLTLKNNKEYLIATKQPEKLKKVVETYREVHHFN